MQDSRRTIQPSYNGQIAVDEKEQVIIAWDITQETADHHELIKMVEMVEQNLELYPKRQALMLDTPLMRIWNIPSRRG